MTTVRTFKEIYVDAERSHVMLDDGTTLPITTWICDGEDCEPDEATAIVAGPTPEGDWITIELIGGVAPTLH